MRIFPLLLFSASLAWPSTGSVGAVSLTYPVRVEQGWNLLSIPVKLTDGTPDSVFPTSGSDAIIYENGYRVLDTLRNGPGIWVKFSAAETIMVSGAGSFLDSTNLRAGWNLIGGLSTPVATGLIETEPAGIVSSKYYRYIPGLGYEAADTLWPGSGYWVKSAGPGRLHLMTRDIPCPGYPAVDIGGRTYQTVQIGNQCWLRENLDVGEYVEGGVPQTDNGVIEKYCFNDDPLNCVYYGGLYQWDEATRSPTAGGPGGICPAGWHVPSEEDFSLLRSSVRGDGNVLKALREGFKEGIGTNTSGFTALLGGYRQLNGYFSIQGYYIYFWSSTPKSTTTSTSFFIFGEYSDTYFIENQKDYGFCIRCIKD